MKDINYAKEALTHNYNYYVIAVFVFLMLVTSSFWGWFYLLAAVEVGVWLSSYTSPIQRLLYLANYKVSKSEMYEAENNIIESLDSDYQKEFRNLSTLCSKIELRNKNFGQGSTDDLTQKLYELKYKFAKLLEQHWEVTQEVSGKNKISLLNDGIAAMNRAIAAETNPRIKSTMTTNLTILTQRLNRLKQSGDRIRDIESQIDLVKNSLELLYDNSLSFTGDGDVTSSVDGLLANLDVQTPNVDDYKLEDLKKTPQVEVIKQTAYRSK